MPPEPTKLDQKLRLGTDSSFATQSGQKRAYLLKAQRSVDDPSTDVHMDLFPSVSLRI
jgi:hypothetical protein